MSLGDRVLDSVAIDSAVAAQRRTRFPAGAALSLEQIAGVDAPAALAGVRWHEPITWCQELGGWLVTSHELARELLRPNAAVTVQSHQNMVRASLGCMMLTTDGGEHDRLRQPFEVPFRPREVERRFHEEIVMLCEELLLPLRGSSGFSLDEEFAKPFAVRMAARVIGLELADVDQVAGYYETFADAMQYDENPDRLQRANEARGILDELLKLGVERAGSSSLVGEARGAATHALDGQEFIDQLRVIMFGAIETIRATLLTTVATLFTHPLHLDAVRVDPDLMQAAVSEAQRLVPPVAFVERWAAEPLNLGGVDIAEGEFIGISVVATNRDPAVFDHPDEFHLNRVNAQRALTFSFGEHHCLGFHLARLQSVVALSSLEAILGPCDVIEASAATGFAFRRPASVRLRTSAG